MKQTDYIIYDKWNAQPLRFSSGHIAIYGSRKDAIENCLIGYSVISSTDLPHKWKEELELQESKLEEFLYDYSIE